MAKRKVNVKGTEIVVFSKEKEDYISLTDIAKYKDSERTNYIIQNWMRSRSTIEFIGLWELLHKDSLKNNLAFWHLSFRPSWADLQSQNPQNNQLLLWFCSIRSTQSDPNLSAKSAKLFLSES